MEHQPLKILKFREVFAGSIRDSDRRKQKKLTVEIDTYPNVEINIYKRFLTVEITSSKTNFQHILTVDSDTSLIYAI